MKLYLIEPEVAGGWGENTVVSNHAEIKAGSTKIPKVEFLEYAFDDWNGEHLLETFPCFVMTVELAERLQVDGITGFSIQDVLITTTEIFDELNAGRTLPQFVRLIPEGIVAVEGTVFDQWSGHDINITEDARLIVTEKCLAVLNSYHWGHSKPKVLTSADTD